MTGPHIQASAVQLRQRRLTHWLTSFGFPTLMKSLLIPIALIAFSIYATAIAKPSTQPHASKPRRLIEASMLGSVDEIKGVKWPTTSRGELELGVSIYEPCDLILHLSNAKTIKVRTRPILVLNREMYTDVLSSFMIPPDSEPGTLREKAREIERIAAKWGMPLSKLMKSDLREWKTAPYSTRYIHGDSNTYLRTGGPIDCTTNVAFRLDPSPAGWRIVIEVEATQAPCDAALARTRPSRRTGVPPKTRPATGHADARSRAVAATRRVATLWTQQSSSAATERRRHRVEVTLGGKIADVQRR